MMDFLKERPPYISFEARIREVRNAEGLPRYEPVDFVKITPVGSKDIVEREVQPWFETLKFQVSEGRMPGEWERQFRGAYAMWKEGQEIPVDGTPVANWPCVNSAEAKLLISLRCKTVEDLAVATEETLNRIGMGARGLKQRAQDWLTAQSGTGPLVMQLDAERHSRKALEARVEELTATVQTLRTVAEAARPNVAPAPSGEYHGTIEEPVRESISDMVDNLTRI